MFLIVPGQPQGKLRARTFYDARMGRTRSITPPKTQAYEKEIKKAFENSNSKQSWLDGEPLAVDIDAYFPIPKSTSKKNRELIKNGKLMPTKKPDIDNIAKVICDALNGLAYKDDTQFVQLKVNKYYTEDEPCVEVFIRRFEND